MGMERNIAGSENLKASIQWCVGDGRNIQVQYHPWLPVPWTFKTLSRHEDLPERVADLIDSHIGAWNSEIIGRCFESGEARIILGIPLSKFGCPDKLVWHHIRNGMYFVKSRYWIAQELD